MPELFSTPYFKDSTLKGYWRLNGSSVDETGNGNSGTDTAVTYNDANGMFFRGAGFNGTTSKIVLPSNASLKPTTNFTIMTWFKTSTAATQMCQFGSFSQNTFISGISFDMPAGGNVLRLLSGKNTGTTIGTDAQVVTGATTVTDGLWHFGVGVWDGSNLKVYLDGNLDGSTVWANAPAYAATTYQRIGDRGVNGTDFSFWNGAIDEVALFNGKAFTIEEINLIYRSSPIVKYNRLRPALFKPGNAR